MADLKEQLSEFAESAFGFVKATKESYDAGTRFMKMRVWIVGALALDLVVTLWFVMFTGGQPLNLIIWYQPGFPSNILVVRNDGSLLKDVTLVLDNKYSARVDRIEKGPNGYEMNHAFHDKDDFAPPDSYRPAEVEVHVDRDVVRIPIGTQGPKGGG